MSDASPFSGTVITLVTHDDEMDWLSLWHAYLRFYKTHLSEGITRATWRRILDPNHAFRCFIARDSDNGMPLGFALHHPQPSSWCTVGDMYLEDLFVTTDARGKGTGRALIEAVIESAQSEKFDRVYWVTDEANTSARLLYDRITGGSDGHLRYRLVIGKK